MRTSVGAALAGLVYSHLPLALTVNGYGLEEA